MHVLVIFLLENLGGHMVPEQISTTGQMSFVLNDNYTQLLQDPSSVPLGVINRKWSLKAFQRWGGQLYFAS